MDSGGRSTFVDDIVLVIAICDMRDQRTLLWEVEAAEEYGLRMPQLAPLHELFLHARLPELDHHTHLSRDREQRNSEMDDVLQHRILLEGGMST